MSIPAATQGALQRYYKKNLSEVVRSTKRVSPFWVRATQGKGRVVPSAFGDAFVIGVYSQTQQTASGDYSEGYTKATGGGAGAEPEIGQFIVPVARSYSHGKLTGSEILQSESPAAFAKLAKLKIDAAILEAQERAAALAFGDGSGARGRIATLGANFFTVTLAADVRNFAKGMSIVAAAAPTSGALLNTTAANVTSVDPANNKIFTDVADHAATLSWSTAAGGSYLFVKGDRPTSWSRTVMLGVGFWIPSALPAVGSGADSSGIERATVELAGHRVTYTGGTSFATAIIKGSGYAETFGLSTVSALYANPQDVANYMATKDAAATVTINSGKYLQAGWEVPKVYFCGSQVPLFTDAGVPAGTIFALDESTWHIPYAGDDVIHMREDAGILLQNIPGSDAYAFASRSLLNIACSAPGKNLRITFS